MRREFFAALVLLSLLFFGCSNDDSAGVTGVGNPSEVSLLGKTGELKSTDEFAVEEGMTRAGTPTIISDKKRQYTLESVEVLVDIFSWEIDTNTLVDEIHSDLTQMGTKLFYYGPEKFDILDTSNRLPINLPTAGYKAMRFYITGDGRKATITMKGTYKNDEGIDVPFTFFIPFTMEVRFRKKGSAYFWNTKSSNSLDFIFNLDNWFKGADVLNMFDVDAGSSEELVLTQHDFNKNPKDVLLHKNIRKSGLVHIKKK